MDYIYEKLIKFTGIFYKLRNRLPSKLIKMLYFAFVHSQVSYGIEIYGNTYPTYLNKLNILNNKTLWSWQACQLYPLPTPFPFPNCTAMNLEILPDVL